jgi:hypothetical protein
MSGCYPYERVTQRKCGASNTVWQSMARAATRWRRTPGPGMELRPKIAVGARLLVLANRQICLSQIQLMRLVAKLPQLFCRHTVQYGHDAKQSERVGSFGNPRWLLEFRDGGLCRRRVSRVSYRSSGNAASAIGNLGRAPFLQPNASSTWNRQTHAAATSVARMAMIMRSRSVQVCSSASTIAGPLGSLSVVIRGRQK